MVFGKSQATIFTSSGGESLNDVGAVAIYKSMQSAHGKEVCGKFWNFTPSEITSGAIPGKYFCPSKLLGKV